MTTTKFRLLVTSAAIAMTSLGAIGTASAQEARAEDEGGAHLDEIIVTAQKRSQSAQDVNASISAFDESDVRNFGGDVGALAGQSPGVEAFSGGNSYLQTFFVRGIGLNEFAGNFSAPIAVHRDEVYASKSWAIARPPFDVERIEVLKGPQGTLFGRNATGGAVNYYTKRPTSEFSGSIFASYDEHERGSVEGVISGPLSDTVRGRISFNKTFGSGGPQFNLFTNDEHGRPDVLELRGQIEADLGAATTLRLLAYGGSDKSETPGYQTPGIFSSPGVVCPEALAGRLQNQLDACSRFGGFFADPGVEFETADPFTINQNQAPRKDDKFWGGYVRLDHDLGDLTLTSLTSYDYYKRFNVEDSDGTPIQSGDSSFYNDLKLFTHEFRLAGRLFDRVEFVGGLYYLNEQLTAADRGVLVDRPGLPPTIYSSYDQGVESYAGYMNADIELAPEWTVTLGARYTHDKTDLDAVSGASFSTEAVGNNRIVPGTDLFPPLLTQDSRSDSNFSYRLGISFEPSPDVLLYANYATGYRAGGFSVPFGAAPVVSFDPEDLRSIELGVKADITDRFRVNAAAFHYTYENYQVSAGDLSSPLTPITRNIDEAEIIGLEAEAIWAPVSGLELKLGYAFLDSELTKTDTVGRTFTATFDPIPLQGNTPVNSPRHQVNGSIQYVDGLTNDLDWSFAVDARWVDKRYLRLENQPADRADAYAVANGAIGIRSVNGGWNAQLFVRNITNEKYVTYINNIVGPNIALYIFGEPRTFGVNLGYEF